MGKTLLPDHLQGVPGPRTVRRVFSIEFDSVTESDLFFLFSADGKLIGSVLKSSLNDKQRNFFSAISNPTR